MLLSNTFEITGRILTGLWFSFLHSLCKGDTSAIFTQDLKEDGLKELLIFVHKKSTSMPKVSSIILMEIS